MPVNLPVKWVSTGEDELGVPQFSLHPPDGQEDQPMHYFLTGRASTGEITLPDGSTYHVGPPVIRVASIEHAGLLSHLIGLQHEEAGRLGFGLERRMGVGADEGLVVAQPHLCTEHCGALARSTTAAEAYHQQGGALASGSYEAAAANGGAAVITFVNLHSASTGTNGANELSSTRQAIAWTTGTSGSPNPANTAAISIALAASTTATHLGGWSAVTTGTFELGFPLSPSVTTGTSAGTVTFAIGAVVQGIT